MKSAMGCNSKVLKFAFYLPAFSKSLKDKHTVFCPNFYNIQGIKDLISFTLWQVYVSPKI